MSDPSRDSRRWHFNPSREILQSRLFISDGYLVVSGLFREETLEGLCAEANAVRLKALRSYLADSDETEGCPARAYRSGEGGDLHWALHGCQQMAETLGSLCGVPVSPAGSGTYCYYEQAGDFLALHRDVLDCDITVITSLTKSTADALTGELVVYPQFIKAPLSTVRSAGRACGTIVPLDRGQTIILLGGIVPHEVAPMRVGQERIVAINCYRTQTADFRNAEPLSTATEEVLVE
jgi:hypothetical protein